MKTILRMLWALPLLLLAAAAVAPVEAFTLQAGGNSPYLCATTSNAATGNGTPVILEYCSGYPNQRWNWVNGQIQGPTANGIECLDNLVALSAEPPQPVYMNPCSGSESQQWVVGFSTAPGTVNSYDNAFCLDSVGGLNVGGFTQVVIDDCNNGTSQNWTMQRLEISLAGAYPYQCIAVEGGVATRGTNAIVTSCNDSPSQRWALQNDSLMGLGTWDGTSLCLVPSGSYVTLGSCSPKQWGIGLQYFVLYGAIIDITGYVYCMDSSGPQAPGGTYLVLNDCVNFSATQTWALR